MTYASTPVYSILSQGRDILRNNAVSCRRRTRHIVVASSWPRRGPHSEEILPLFFDLHRRRGITLGRVPAEISHATVSEKDDEYYPLE